MFAIYCQDIYQRNIVRAKHDIQQLSFTLLFHNTVVDCSNTSINLYVKHEIYHKNGLPRSCVKNYKE